MIDETLYQSGTKPSTIFQLFEYGLKQAAVVGRENVYDYSLGNPSVPAPQQVTDAFQRLLGQEDPVSLHGYTPAAGALDVRQSIAADLSARSGMDIRPQNLFLTCGAAPALLYVLRALAVAQAEVIAITPYFPEYRVYAEACGMRFVPTQADLDQFQINLTSLEDCITPHLLRYGQPVPAVEPGGIVHLAPGGGLFFPEARAVQQVEIRAAHVPYHRPAGSGGEGGGGEVYRLVAEDRPAGVQQAQAVGGSHQQLLPQPGEAVGLVGGVGVGVPGLAGVAVHEPAAQGGKVLPVLHGGQHRRRQNDGQDEEHLGDAAPEALFFAAPLGSSPFSLSH